MTRIKKILVATDCSENARKAETRAAMLSVELKADDLEMLAIRQTVRMGLSTPSASVFHCTLAESEIAAMAEGEAGSAELEPAHGGPHCVRRMRTGKSASAITDHASRLHADLTVVAAQERRFLSSFLTGACHHDVVQACTRPVLVVKSEPQSAYRRVLVAVDFSEQSKEAARMALAIAPDAHVSFVHACRLMHEGMMREAGLPPDSINGYRIRLRERSRTQLNQFIAELGPQKQLASRTVQYGHAAPVIFDLVKKISPDLIAVGKTGRSLLEQVLVGSLTKRLIDEAPCDLLVAPLDSGPGWDDRPAA
ncbi:universal stress protein [Noviherbaspirillum malthae]|uniref:universal stress protein n=1 Tax=Noviherbaspirillum malthae TaxID=1260987 RepID=UPI001890AA88|nr:universal stress protein [Noviherbaspirillum malthae]